MIRAVALGVICSALAFGAAAQEDAQHLTLSCRGIGSKLESHSTFAQVYGSGGSAFGSATSLDDAQAPERVTIVIDGTGGRVHLPGWLVPPIHGGSDGWFALTKIDMQPDRITGSFGINFINHPHFTIDRRTGEIDMNGFAHLSFEGTCERGPDASAPAKF